MPLSTKYFADDFEKIIKLFPPGSDTSKISDYDGVYSEFLVLAHHCKDIYDLTDILNISEMHKQVLPTINKILRLMFTAPYSTSSNERSFSNLKLIKNCLRSTMHADRLQNLMLLNTNKDLLDIVDLKNIVGEWATVKQRRINI